MRVPEDFIHGFVVMLGMANVLYRATNYHAPERRWCIAWNDENLAITRHMHGKTVLFMKDAQGKLFAETELFS